MNKKRIFLLTVQKDFPPSGGGRGGAFAPCPRATGPIAVRRAPTEFSRDSTATLDTRATAFLPRDLNRHHHARRASIRRGPGALPSEGLRPSAFGTRLPQQLERG